MVPLKTLFVGLCLLLVTQAAAATNAEHAAHAATFERTASTHRTTTSALSLEQRLARAKRAVHTQRGKIRYFRNHPALLRSTRARVALRRAHRGLVRATRTRTSLVRAIARRNTRRLAKAPPRTAICHVFGRSHCQQALAVSWCESRHSTSAQNGQYLGLFQMGSYERGMFGHGSTALDQAVAAHKYFVLSGRDWSPWSCKPSHAAY